MPKSKMISTILDFRENRKRRYHDDHKTESPRPTQWAGYSMSCQKMHERAEMRLRSIMLEMSSKTSWRNVKYERCPVSRSDSRYETN
ncbi:hypothetical protein TNCV_687781 [Trichonephila clavipes]|nr:hypothetical protein TNCV_687781 [Trichonephila clavipes]